MYDGNRTSKIVFEKERCVGLKAMAADGYIITPPTPEALKQAQEEVGSKI